LAQYISASVKHSNSSCRQPAPCSKAKGVGYGCGAEQDVIPACRGSFLKIKKDSGQAGRAKIHTHKSGAGPKSKYAKLLFCFLVVACFLLFAVFCCAEILERVIAYVNNTAITLSEFRKDAERTRKTLGNVSDADIINSMINRILLLQEAKKMRLEAPDDDKLVQEYIDIKLKSAIIIREEDIEHFYNESRGQFKGQDYLAVRDQIEKYLFELETNKRLKSQIEELRAKSDIKIQLRAGE